MYTHTAAAENEKQGDAGKWSPAAHLQIIRPRNKSRSSCRARALARVTVFFLHFLIRPIKPTESRERVRATFENIGPRIIHPRCVTTFEWSPGVPPLARICDILLSEFFIVFDPGAIYHSFRNNYSPPSLPSFFARPPSLCLLPSFREV